MDQKVADLAIGMARVTTRERIREGFGCVPFVLLYDELVRAKEITRLSELDRETKIKYWKQSEGTERIDEISGVKVVQRYRRVFVCVALYVYDLITQNV